jgi:hypothetical protein
MSEIKNHIRQGDVLVIDCEDESFSGVVPKEDHVVILARGEATGHAHALRDSSAKMYFSMAAKGATNEKPARVLSLVKTVNLTHEEHTQIPLTVGNKRVIQQVEYTPTEQRRVAD